MRRTLAAKVSNPHVEVEGRGDAGAVEVETAGHRHRVGLNGGRAERDVPLSDRHAVGGIPAAPSDAGEKNLGPGVEVALTVGGFGGGLIAAHEAAGEPQAARGSEKEDRQVTTGAAPAGQRLGRGLGRAGRTDVPVGARVHRAAEVREESDGAMADLGGDAAREGRDARVPVAGPRPEGGETGIRGRRPGEQRQRLRRGERRIRRLQLEPAVDDQLLDRSVGKVDVHDQIAGGVELVTQRDGLWRHQPASASA